jgi:hypothetical protein
VKELWSPDAADAGSQAAWWGVEATGGPEVVFVGVSDRMLGEAELRQVESSAAFMTKLLGDGQLKLETMHPERTNEYVRVGGATYLARGGSRVPIISPKTFATDHTELVKFFSAYHAWIFQTESVSDDSSSARRETRRRANRRDGGRDSVGPSEQDRESRRADVSRRSD